MTNEARQMFPVERITSLSAFGDTKGENNGHAKLTPEDVLEIRRLGTPYRNINRRGHWENVPGLSQYVLAERFGVSHQCISLILRRVTWRHL